MQPTRLFDLVSHQIKHYPQDNALSDLYDGHLRTYSIVEVDTISNQIAHGLLNLGLQPGDRIAMVTNRNRIEFTLLDLGIQKAGLVSVPLYPTISAHEYAYIIEDAGCKAVFFGTNDLAAKILQANEKAQTIQHFFALDSSNPEGQFWEDIWKNEDQGPIGTDIDPLSLTTIIYTSGTTGHPKGVMLSHENIVTNVIDVANVSPISAGHRAISFLPLCHVFERTAAFFYMYLGTTITYTAIDNLGGDDGDLRRLQPHFFTCVPRLLEKIYERIYAKGLALKGLKKRLFFWALQLTEDYSYDKEYSGLDKWKRTLADRLIFSKWREALGGEVIGVLTGSAPCPERIARIFAAAGIPVREAYGLTESSPGLTFNGYTPGNALLGTVGPTLDHVDIRIDDSDKSYGDGIGEILAAGPNIMMGYYNKPEETAAVLKEIDGRTWLLTGDIGTLIKGPSGRAFLKITDRKKELLKSSAGKYIAPAPIESRLKEDMLVEQAMIVGDGKKFASAIISVSQETLRAHIEGLKMNLSPTEAIKDPIIIAKYEEIVNTVNRDFARHEQIKKFILVADTWDANAVQDKPACLTPTLKLKRRVISKRYTTEIENIYS